MIINISGLLLCLASDTGLVYKHTFYEAGVDETGVGGLSFICHSTQHTHTHTHTPLSSCCPAVTAPTDQRSLKSGGPRPEGTDQDLQCTLRSTYSEQASEKITG